MKTIRKAILGLSLGAISILSNSPAQALTWTLTGVTFQYDETATGSFDYVQSTNTYSNIDITINSATNSPLFTFNDSNLSSSYSGSGELLLCDNIYLPNCSNPPDLLQISFSGDGLNDTGGTVSLYQPGVVARANGGSYANLTGGSVSTTASAPFDFPTEEIVLTIPLFLGLREFQKRKSILTKV